MRNLYYTPDSHHSGVLKSRKEIYDHLASSFKAMGQAGFCNIELGSDAFRTSFEDQNSSGYEFRDQQGDEITANLFGEILGNGTLLGARGNHSDADGRRVMTDHTKARNVIVLGCPSFSPQSVRNLFYNQVCSGVSMRSMDEKEEKRLHQRVDVKHFIKSTYGNGHFDSIALTGECIFGTAEKRFNPMKRELYKKRLIDEDRPQKRNAHDTVPALYPLGNDIHVGARYDPKLLPDYGGRGFSQKFAKIIQQDWRDIDMSLIPPWDYTDKLRPGTLVVACVTFRVYVSPDRSKPSVLRKVYVAHIKSLKVIGTSDVPVASAPHLTRSNAVAAAFNAIKACTSAAGDFSLNRGDDVDPVIQDGEGSAI